MRWATKQPFDTGKWHKWFAWHPVEIPGCTYSSGGTTVWLETVWRKATGADMNGVVYEYAALEDISEDV